MANTDVNNDAGSKDNQVFACATYCKCAVPGISYEESRNVYNEWSTVGKYEEDMNADNYRGPSAGAQKVADLFPEHREDLLILDATCGSGFVAQHLKNHGFKRIHGFDASTGMLDLARQKNVYEELFCCFLDANPLPMNPATYDCLVMVGGFLEGHVPTSGLRSMARVVKPGGSVVIVMRESFLTEVAEYKDRLEREMEAMEGEGLWRLLSRTPLPNYFHHHMGVVFTFRLC